MEKMWRLTKLSETDELVTVAYGTEQNILMLADQMNGETSFNYRAEPPEPKKFGEDLDD